MVDLQDALNHRVRTRDQFYRDVVDRVIEDLVNSCKSVTGPTDREYKLSVTKSQSRHHAVVILSKHNAVESRKADVSLNVTQDLELKINTGHEYIVTDFTMWRDSVKSAVLHDLAQRLIPA